MNGLEQSKHYELFIVLIAGFGVFLTALDLLIANVAIPQIQDYFSVSTNTISWILTIYTLLLSTTIILSGRLSDRFGHLKLFRIGIVIFGIASLLAGFSENISILIFLRAIQGLGAGIIQATAAALITVLLPKASHPKALAGYSAFFGIGNVLGASMGGFIVTFFHWGWIFWINIPFCIIILICSFKLKQKLIPATKSLDLKGIIIYATSAFLLIYGIENLSNSNDFNKALIYIALSIAIFTYLIFFENKQKFPAINFKIFFGKNTFPLSIGVLSFAYMLSTIYVLSPLVLHSIFKMSPWEMGLITLISPLSFTLCTYFTKNLIGKISDKPLQFIGIAIMGLPLLGLYFATEYKNIYLFATFLAIFGIGNSLFLPANFHAYLKQVNKEWQGSASALCRMLSALGMSIGACISTATVQIFHTQFSNITSGYLMAWIFGFFVSIVGCTLFVFYKNTKQDTTEKPSDIIIAID